jgi:Ca-activated chloride channel family protein
VRAAKPRVTQVRRHLPIAVLRMAVVSRVVALAPPGDVVSVPTGQATIILALDVSLSMIQNDIPPSRLDAAKAAAISFIRSQKSSTQIGIVAFAGYAEMVQAPTSDQEALESAVESLTVGRGTAIGSGLLEAIDAISEIDPLVAPSVSYGSEPDPSFTPVPKGAYAPDIIVLLTDGVATTGPLPLDAAQQAVDRGVRVYTIGFGTEAGQPDFRGGGPNFFGGGPPGGGQQFGGGGGRGGGFRRGIDEETLKEIAAMTDGKYYEASSASELTSVFQNLPTSLIMKHEVMEISVIFVALGAVAAAIAVAFSLRWHPLP